MPAAISSANYATRGLGEQSAGQGLWLCGGDQVPEALLAALCGKEPWAGPDWLEDETPFARPGSDGGAGRDDADVSDDVAARDGGAGPGLDVGFCQGGALDGLGPGPELGLLLPDAAGLARLGDAELTGVVRGWRRLSSWAAAMESAAVAVLAGRRIAEAGAAGASESDGVRYAGAEVAAALTLTRCSADTLVGRALALAELSGTWAGLASGAIDVPRALVIADGVAGLGSALAGRVEAQVLTAAPGQTTGELRKAVARAVFAADPSAAEERCAQAQKSARVERWAEPSGTGAIAGRDLPPADVLAADNRVNALAAALKADGAGGGMDLLRARVFLSLLLNRPLTAATADRCADAPGADDAAHTADEADADRGDAPAAGAAPGLPDATGAGRSGSVNLTVPLLTLLGLSGQPGEVAGFGPVSGPVAGEILGPGWGGSGSRWCVTVTDEQGGAVGHGCARPKPGRNGVNWALLVRVSALAVNECAHRRESSGYVPPPSLRHVIQIRNSTCTFPGCRRPARQCEQDHTIPYNRGGRTCECNLAPLCHFHHQLKHRTGWTLEQSRPGVLQWTAPSGWKYTTMPGRQLP